MPVVKIYAPELTASMKEYKESDVKNDKKNTLVSLHHLGYLKNISKVNQLGIT